METALLIIDIQNDYFKSGNMELIAAEEASVNAKLILEKFRNTNKQIIHIQHVTTRKGVNFFLPNTFGVEIHKNVSPKPNESIVIKHTPNSFKDTELLQILQSNKITNLVIVGMMTHTCIDSTVRAAKDLGFNCILIGNACATKDLEIQGEITKAKDVHNAFLSALNYYYSTVITTQEYLDKDTL